MGPGGVVPLVWARTQVTKAPAASRHSKPENSLFWTV